jgi:hypothetical protein
MTAPFEMPVINGIDAIPLVGANLARVANSTP